MGEWEVEWVVDCRKEIRGESGEVGEWVDSEDNRRPLLARLVGELALRLVGGADMEVLNSSSSLPVDCTSMHSGE